MKRNKLFLSIALFFFIAIPLLAQTTSTGYTLSELNQQNSQSVYYTSVLVDSGSTKYSNPFTITNFATESLTTYPAGYSYRVTKNAGGDSTNCAVYLLGVNGDPTINANWFTVDTLVTIIELKATATPLIHEGTANLNNKKADYYKLKFVAATGTFCKKFYLTHFALHFSHRK